MKKSGINLYFPKYWEYATPKEREWLCNGCGAKPIKVSDSILGLDISIACKIHDFQYAFAKNEVDKAKADSAFLTNMIALIDRKASLKDKILAYPRRCIATIYYGAVRDFGFPFIGVSDDKKYIIEKIVRRYNDKNKQISIA